jgi:hypothetical protein
MLATLPFTLNFAHPLMEWSLLATGGWALYLGIKVKRTRTGTPEQRKLLVPKKFAQRHYLWGSILLALMTLGTLGGMAVTYLNNDKLFVGPHLLVGLAMTGMLAGRGFAFPPDAAGKCDCSQGPRWPEHGNAHPVSLAGLQWHGDRQQDLDEPLKNRCLG